MTTDAQIHQMIGRIDERTENTDKTVTEIKGLVQNLSARVNNLETENQNNKSKAKGIMIGMSLGSGTIGAILSKVFPFGWH